MTLVFRTESGYLQQTQIGPTDIVTTFSAAQSAWGWIGGLDGARRLLKSLSITVSEAFKRSTGFRIPQNLEVLPLAGQIFTENGAQLYAIDSNPGIFGGEFSSKLIGLSICAIAHDCGDQQAVHLFMKCLAPALFPRKEVVKDALHGTLMDNYPKIINEGASRGLTTFFVSAANTLNLPPSDRGWLKDNMGSTSKPFPLEISMVGGLLRWLTVEERTTYFTRSSLVIRVAACLKEVGYLVNIRSWDGLEPFPKPSGPSIILVLGGSSPTDTMMLSEGDEIPQDLCLHHYSFSTVGAMFSNAVYDQSGISPEAFQSIFEKIYLKVQEHLTYKWTAVPYGERTEAATIIRALLTWRPWSGRLTNRAIASRLASMNFPTLGDTVAFCYEGLDNEAALKEVLEFKKGKAHKTTSRSLIHFRAVTASIVISIVAKLSGNTFEDCHHLIALTLTTDNWLKSMCSCLDHSIASLSLSQVVLLLAAVHAGAEPTAAFQLQSKTIIGWRQGIYAVIPALLTEMAPTSNAIGLQCIDRFWGNSLVYEDGSIRGGLGSGIFEDTDMLANAEKISSGDVQSIRGPHLGPPRPGSPDVPLYLAIERPLHYNSRDLSLRGRIDGQPVGTVGIVSILEVLIRSFEEGRKCSGHADPKPVFNIRPSLWAKQEHYKPVGGNFNTFIPVKGDNAWTLFLAGQTSAYNGKIVFRCFDCAGESVETGSPLIGFI